MKTSKGCVLQFASATNFANANNNGNANYNNASNTNNGAFPIRTRESEHLTDVQNISRDKENATCHLRDDERGSQMLLDTSNATSTGSISFSDNKLFEITTIKKLNNSFYENQKASDWKYSTQLYEDNLLEENFKLQKAVRNGDYREGLKTHFGLKERGKHREIDAPKMRDRVIGKSLNQNVLLPCIKSKLIYDNYASLKNRGTSLARKRLRILLNKAIKEFGPDFYCAKLDVKSYFPNIDRKLLYKKIKDIVPYESVHSLIRRTIGPVNELGLNLGSECPQSYAIFYLNDVDQFCKVVLGLKYYGRYMDDIFIFAKTKEELKKLIEVLAIYINDRLHLQFNMKKTMIVSSKQGFTFMQVNYRVTAEGKIYSSPCNERFRRERRKLRNYRSLWDKDKCKMTLKDVKNSFLSWKGETLKLGNCAKRVAQVEKLYNELFAGLKERPLVVDQESTRYISFGGD